MKVWCSVPYAIHLRALGTIRIDDPRIDASTVHGSTSGITYTCVLKIQTLKF